MQFASEVRPEVVRDISKSVLSKSRLHELHAFMEKKFGDKWFKVWEWRDFDYWRLLQQEWFERGRSRKWHGSLRCVKTKRFGTSDRLSTRKSKTQLPWFRNRCDKHHYHCSFSSVWKSRCFYTCFFIVLLLFIKFMLRYCGDHAFSASFVRECTDVSHAGGERVELTVQKEIACSRLRDSG